MKTLLTVLICADIPKILQLHRGASFLSVFKVACFCLLVVMAPVSFADEPSGAPLKTVSSIAELQLLQSVNPSMSMKFDGVVSLSFAAQDVETIYAYDEKAAIQVFVDSETADALSRERVGVKFRLSGDASKDWVGVKLTRFEIVPDQPKDTDQKIGVLGTSDQLALNGLALVPMNVREALISRDRVSLFGYRGMIPVLADVYQTIAREDVLPWIHREINATGAILKVEKPTNEAIFKILSMSREQLPPPTSDANLLEHYRSGAYQAKYFRQTLGHVLFTDGISLVIVETSLGKRKLFTRFANSLRSGDNIAVLEWKSNGPDSVARDITSCLIEVNTHQPLASPIRMSYDEIRKNGDTTSLVKIQGTVRDIAQQGNMIAMEIMCENGIVLAKVPAKNTPNSIFPAEVTDVVKVSGVPWVMPSSGNSSSKIELFVSSHYDIVPDNSGLKIDWQTIGSVLAAVLAIVCIIVAWNLSLRNQILKRTATLQSIGSRLKNSYEAFRGAVLVEDESHRIVNMNEKFIKFCGDAFALNQDSSAAFQRLGSLLEGEPNFQLFCDNTRELQSERAIVEQQFRHKNTGRTIQVTSSAIIDSRRIPRGYLWCFEDITEQLSIQQKLLQTQKMEAIGQLSSGFAHDFNNMLAIIRANLSLIDIYHDRGLEIAEFSSSANHVISRATEITRHLLDYSRLSDLTLKPIDINQVVRQSFSLLRHSMSQDIDLRVDCSPEASFVLADEARLEQVILNIGINARDAMKDGKGVITITTGTNCRSGTDFVTIAITDNGCGMNQKTQIQVFEPFFTTKESGKGTGLGLSMASGIVEQFNGTITCTSELGKGTEFLIAIPRIEASQTCEPPPDFKLRPQSSVPLRILLVDDELQIRDSVGKMLQLMGCDVISAANGNHAFKILCERQDFDVVLLDLNMPEMSGADLLIEIDQRWPWLNVVICSGYTTPLLKEPQFKNLQKPHFLAKPFDFAELQNALEGVQD